QRQRAWAAAVNTTIPATMSARHRLVALKWVFVMALRGGFRQLIDPLHLSTNAARRCRADRVASDRRATVAIAAWPWLWAG
ncbi:MAG: hypothetical protein EBZ24_13995, partial [Synechococcaceae bacterium WB9_4xB_025]|nr:hypothetical protein [Synechococcaceae bacterium WB9_4xB_025]